MAQSGVVLELNGDVNTGLSTLIRLYHPAPLVCGSFTVRTRQRRECEHSSVMAMFTRARMRALARAHTHAHIHNARTHTHTLLPSPTPVAPQGATGATGGPTATLVERTSPFSQIHTAGSGPITSSRSPTARGHRSRGYSASSKVASKMDVLCQCLRCSFQFALCSSFHFTASFNRTSIRWRVLSFCCFKKMQAS